LCGEGEGAITALVNGWQRQTGMHIDVLDYSEHAHRRHRIPRRRYVLLSVEGTRMCGVAVGRDVVNASLQAVINGAAQIRPCARAPEAARPACREGEQEGPPARCHGRSRRPRCSNPDPYGEGIVFYAKNRPTISVICHQECRRGSLAMAANGCHSG
jgi:hypothetical protein